MRKAIAVSLSVLMLCGCKTPFCHSVHPFEGQSDVYWESSWITNGNGKTHICAHMNELDGTWYVEIPFKRWTATGILNSKSKALAVVHEYCSGGE